MRPDTSSAHQHRNRQYIFWTILSIEYTWSSVTVAHTRIQMETARRCHIGIEKKTLFESLLSLYLRDGGSRRLIRALQRYCSQPRGETTPIPYNHTPEPPQHRYAIYLCNTYIEYVLAFGPTDRLRRTKTYKKLSSRHTYIHVRICDAVRLEVINWI